MKTTNFQIIPLTTIDRVVAMGRLFQNALGSPPFASRYFQEGKLFALTDHTGMGLKYVMSTSPAYVGHIKAYQNIESTESDTNEIILFFQKNGLVSETRTESLTDKAPEILNYESLETRNQELEKVLNSFIWADKAQVCFCEERISFNFECSTQTIKLPLKGNFSSESLSFEQKSFFIEHDIREQDIKKLEEQLVNIQTKFHHETFLFMFSYEKGKGLISHE